MLDLSGRGDEDVKQICSTALNQVPPDMVQLDDKMVKVLVSLLSATGNSVVGDGGSTVSEPSVHDLKPWSLRSASIADNPFDVQPSWINYVCQDFEVSTPYNRYPVVAHTCERTCFFTPNVMAILTTPPGPAFPWKMIAWFLYYLDE